MIKLFLRCFFVVKDLRINPFYATGLFLYPLKTSEIQRFCDVFIGGGEGVYRKRSIAWNVLNLEKIANFEQNRNLLNSLLYD